MSAGQRSRSGPDSDSAVSATLLPPLTWRYENAFSATELFAKHSVSPICIGVTPIKCTRRLESGDAVLIASHAFSMGESRRNVVQTVSISRR